MSMLLNKPIVPHPDVFNNPLGRAFSRASSVFQRMRSQRQLKRMKAGAAPRRMVPSNSGDREALVSTDNPSSASSSASSSNEAVSYTHLTLPTILRV